MFAIRKEIIYLSEIDKEVEADWLTINQMLNVFHNHSLEKNENMRQFITLLESWLPVAEDIVKSCRMDDLLSNNEEYIVLRHDLNENNNDVLSLSLAPEQLDMLVNNSHAKTFKQYKSMFEGVNYSYDSLYNFDVTIEIAIQDNQLTCLTPIDEIFLQALPESKRNNIKVKKMLPKVATLCGLAQLVESIYVHDEQEEQVTIKYITTNRFGKKCTKTFEVDDLLQITPEQDRNIAIAEYDLDKQLFVFEYK